MRGGDGARERDVADPEPPDAAFAPPAAPPVPPEPVLVAGVLAFALIRSKDFVAQGPGDAAAASH